MENIEVQLQNEFADRYRRIWVQRSKFSVCLVLFPISLGDRYEIITLMNQYKGNEQETKVGPLKIAIEQHIKNK